MTMLVPHGTALMGKKKTASNQLFIIYDVIPNTHGQHAFLNDLGIPIYVYCVHSN